MSREKRRYGHPNDAVFLLQSAAGVPEGPFLQSPDADRLQLLP